MCLKKWFLFTVMFFSIVGSPRFRQKVSDFFLHRSAKVRDRTDTYFVHFLEKVAQKTWFLVFFWHKISHHHLGCRWGTRGSGGRRQVSGGKKCKIYDFSEKFQKCPKWVENMFLWCFEVLWVFLGFRVISHNAFRGGLGDVVEPNYY